MPASDPPLLFLVDETNIEPSKHVDFFVFGGLIIDPTLAWELDRKIKAIREEAGFERQDFLKFNAKSRPGHVGQAEWNEAKGAALDAAASVGARLIACLIHHNIAKDREKRVSWQFDHAVRRFHAVLSRADRCGIVIADRLSGYTNENALMADRFGIGLVWEGGHAEDLDRIVLYGSTSAGASHLASAVDIAIGTFAYCVNERRDGWEQPRKLFAKLVPMLMGASSDDGLDPLNHSIVLRPQTVRLYSREYVELLGHLESLDSRIAIPRKGQPYYG